MHADLSRPLRDEVRHHPVNADTRDHQAKQSEEAQQQHGDLPLGNLSRDQFFHRPDVTNLHARHDRRASRRYERAAGRRRLGLFSNIDVFELPSVSIPGIEPGEMGEIVMAFVLIIPAFAGDQLVARQRDRDAQRWAHEGQLRAEPLRSFA
jgi:hypothetical protein